MEKRLYILSAMIDADSLVGERFEKGEYDPCFYAPVFTNKAKLKKFAKSVGVDPDDYIEVGGGE